MIWKSFTEMSRDNLMQIGPIVRTAFLSHWHLALSRYCAGHIVRGRISYVKERTECGKSNVFHGGYTNRTKVCNAKKLLNSMQSKLLNPVGWSHLPLIVNRLVIFRFNEIKSFFRSLAQMSLLFGQTVRGISAGARVFEVKYFFLCLLNRKIGMERELPSGIPISCVKLF